MPGTGGAAAGAARPRTHIWYSSIASTSCPQESKSVPFLKLAPQRCRRLRAASDIAPALGHHAHPGPGQPAGQPLPPAPRPPPARPSPARPCPAQPPRQPNAASAAQRGRLRRPRPPAPSLPRRRRPPAARGGGEEWVEERRLPPRYVSWRRSRGSRGSPPSQLGPGGGGVRARTASPLPSSPLQLLVVPPREDTRPHPHPPPPLGKQRCPSATPQAGHPSGRVGVGAAAGPRAAVPSRSRLCLWRRGVPTGGGLRGLAVPPSAVPGGDPSCGAGAGGTRRGGGGGGGGVETVGTMRSARLTARDDVIGSPLALPAAAGV